MKTNSMKFGAFALLLLAALSVSFVACSGDEYYYDNDDLTLAERMTRAGGEISQARKLLSRSCGTDDGYMAFSDAYVHIQATVDWTEGYIDRQPLAKASFEHFPELISYHFPSNDPDILSNFCVIDSSNVSVGFDTEYWQTLARIRVKVRCLHITTRREEHNGGIHLVTDTIPYTIDGIHVIPESNYYI